MKTLECYNLEKKIKNKTIINKINIDIEEGEILGFIGKNGAGKTTLIKMILGLSKIDNGSIYINSYNILKNHDKAMYEVGSIIENPDTYMYLTGYQNLKLTANLYNLDKSKIDKVVSLVKLEDSIHKKVNTYSLGMRQRLGIALSLLHDPKILIYDEPFNGLDPVGVRDIKKLFMKLAYQEHKSILISSHILSELETFCNKICALKDGKIFYIDKNNNDNIYEFIVDNTSKIKNIDNITIIDKEKFRITSNKNQISKLIKTISPYINIYEVKCYQKNLEDIFIEKLGENND